MPSIWAPGKEIDNSGFIVHSGRAVLSRLIIRAGADADVVQVYDGTSAAGTLIGQATIKRAGHTVEFVWKDGYSVDNDIFVRAGTGDTVLLVSANVFTV